ncbi:type II/IV secretion system protein, partial [Xanthobacter autotrophicus]|nr:type II/IV secretion system protein [Xanthobacter autotrophicus]
ILTLSDEIREMIDRHAGAAAVDKAAIAGGMTTMLDDGILKCRAGITSPAEVLRVTTVR